MTNLNGAALCAAGLWVIFTIAALSPAPVPTGDMWTATASDRIASRPMLARAAPPIRVAAR